MDILDLRFNGKIDPKYARIFNSLSMEMRPHFNQMVADIGTDAFHSIHWWVEGPASRNTLSSPLFHQFCSLGLVHHLAASGKLAKCVVRVDSVAFRDCIVSVLKKNGPGDVQVVLAPGFKVKFTGLLKKTVQPLYFLVFFLVRILCARITRKKSTTAPSGESLVLIDTFILPEYTQSDRWYGILWDNIEAHQKKNVFFVPTLVMTPIGKLITVFRQLRNNSRNFLIKEDYLKLSDIFWLRGHSKKIKSLRLHDHFFLGENLRSLVREDLLNNRDLLTVYESLLLYRFIGRIQKAGIKVRLAIDWFEGQAMDKAWNLGFRDFFPSARKMGYRAFESYPFYMCSFPTENEMHAGSIPHVFAVQGRATVNTLRTFLPEIPVVVIPTFRSGHVWDAEPGITTRSKEQNAFRILVTLPIKIDKAIQILQQLLTIHNDPQYKGLLDGPVEYILKLHPACRLTQDFSDLMNSAPPFFKLATEKSFPKLIRQSDILISEASSTCLEAIACGLPIIVVENSEGLTYSPVPDSMPKEVYKAVDSVEDLIFAVNSYINADPDMKNKQVEIAKQVRENYFEPLTCEGINRLLDISK
jgi:hypothetical protein